MLHEHYVLVHKQFDKTNQVEHMVLQPKPIYNKKKRWDYIRLTAKFLFFLKHFIT